MSARSKIEWTDRTWNCVTGCTKVSSGCKNCYAENVAGRFWAKQYPPIVETRHPEVLPRPREFTDVWTHPDRLDEPLRWRKPSRIFVNSMSDLFHEDVPDEFIEKVFGVMAIATQHTFQVLTKRPERMLQWFTTLGGLESREVCVVRAAEHRGVIFDARGGDRHRYLSSFRMTPEDLARRRIWPGWPLPNVWCGVSCENQETADERIPLLLQTPAAVRFISCEPLLGPIGLAHHFPHVHGMRPDRFWTIVGGESGPGARRCNVAWIRSVVQQCQRASVPAFVKQLGAHVIDRNDAGFDGCEPTSWPEMDPFAIEHDIDGYREEYQGAPVRVRLRDRKGGTPEEWPEDLRIREFPDPPESRK